MKEYRNKQSIKIIIILLCVLSYVSSISCENILGEAQLLVADAGEDKETIVGGYAVMDASGSTGPIGYYIWKEDENNPTDVPLVGLASYPIQKIGFIEEGVYRFMLRVISGADTSAPDTVTVTVKPNPQNIFEDPNLESCVRVSLEEPSGLLTDAMLLSLDTVRWVAEDFVVTEDITSLKGLELCKNLERLDFTLQQITDLSPLVDLKKLTRLDIDQNYNISDISPLANLTELRHLDINCNNISDISPLQNLTKLTYLNITFNPITDISIIGNLVNLEEFYSISVPNGDISVLANLRKLRKLGLDDFDIKDISPLKDLINLRYLSLEWNQITDIIPLSNLTKLEDLDLTDNQIEDISPLESLNNLDVIHLLINRIEDIYPLVKNYGLGNGDYVSLALNPLNEKSINEYIPALRKRGVFVFWVE